MGLGAGTLVGQNVRLVRLLGQGGMGSVWVADHLTLETQVAVKFMAAEITENPEAVTRFKREASAAAQIKSPHVVQIADHGITADGLPFIVMELLEGEDLSHCIERRGRLPPADVAQIITQACKALTRAHALGIIHRDLKPENIFLTESDGDVFVKVLDFGIAKSVSDGAFNVTTTGTMVGTPYYMSPEQVMSAKNLDLRSDLWSLAVVAYHALTGTLPFQAETMGGLCVAINSAAFEAPSRRVAALGPAIDAFFTKALARDPALRFASAKDLARELSHAVGFVEDNFSDVSAQAPLPKTAGLAVSGAATNVLSQSAAHAQPLAGTLMEATVTASGVRQNQGLLLALALGGGAVLALIGMIAIVLVVRGRSDANVTSGIEVVPSPGPAAASAPAAVEPSPPPPIAPATEAPAEAPAAAPPPEQKTDPAPVAEKPTERAQPAAKSTKVLEAPPKTEKKPTSAPTSTAKKPPSKPSEDYGF